ncbi:MAG: hypothetical protein ACU0DT_02165 [Albimonas sp.]|uniref:hypothetical protein n=1 Tax=Albimonas sp. TaxID=1872425 RepID=UPI0040579A00
MTPPPDAPHPEQAAWAPWLEPGERLLWVNEPDTRWMTRGDWMILALASPVLLMLAVLLAIPGLREGDDAVWILAGLAAAIGLAGWKLWERSVRRGTRYALTDRRAVAATRWPERRIRSIPLDQGSAPSLDAGFGRLTFGDPPPRGRGAELRRWTWRKPWLIFDDLALPEARRIHALAGAARKGLEAGSATRNGSAPT